MRHNPGAFFMVAVWLWLSASRGDEFIGPLPGWANAQAEYGAKGDGEADDTAALQKALDDLRKPDFPKRVLYLPAGVYRITGTLKVLRTAHSESQGIAIYGEDPEKTIIKWNGPADGVMLQYNPWYSALGRLTFDGQGKAKTAIDFSGKFSTANEIADLIVKDVQFGLEAGHMTGEGADGIAETAVLRCRWHRCGQAAISIQNFNSLDWYIWRNWFEDCNLGATNEFGAGNFHVYESVFLRSKEADISTKHCGYFSFYRNLSVGAKAFYLGKRHQNWKDTETHPCQVAIQENAILLAGEGPAVAVRNQGPIFLLDNIVSGKSAPLVWHQPTAEQADTISIGNLYSCEKAVEVKGRLTQLVDRTGSVEIKMGGPYPFLPRRERPIIVIPAKAEATAIQAAIDEAAKQVGKRPVVYLPAGKYELKQGLLIPRGSDVQIVGDGIENATKISLAAGAGPLLTVQGPSRATIRNLDLVAGQNAVAVLVKDCDQPGSRIFGEQCQTNGHEYGVVAKGLKHAEIFLHDHGHNGLQVIGNGGENNPLVALFCGASSRHTHHAAGIHLYDVQKGGRLLVRDIWYEGHAWSILRLQDRGEFIYHCGFVAPYPAFDQNFANIPWEADLRQQVASLEFDGFCGKVALTLVSANGGAVRVKPPSPNLRLLLLGYVSNASGDDFGGEALQGRVAVAHLRFHRSRLDNLGSDAKPGYGEIEPDWVAEMLKPLRQTKPCALAPTPEDASDLRFFRIMASGRQAMRIE